MGAGRTDIMKAIFGYEPLDSGQIFINGQEVKIDSPIDAIRQRIAFITEDRKSEGLVLDFNSGKFGFNEFRKSFKGECRK